MKDYIPTVEELQDKPVSELNAIFCKAAAVAHNAKREPAERAAAETTMNNVRRCLGLRPGPN